MPDGRDAAESRRVSVPTAPSRAATSVAVSAAGAIAAWVLPESPVGIGMTLVALSIAVAVVVSSPGDITPLELAFGAVAFLLSATASFRAAEWVVGVNLLVAATTATIAVTRAGSWAAMIAAPLAVSARVLEVPGLVLRPLGDVIRGKRIERLVPAARGGVAGVLLLVVFGTLFATADAAFARLATNVLVPNWDVGLLPARVVVFGLVTLVTGALVLARPRFATTWIGEAQRSWDSFWADDRPRRRASLLEWGIPIVLLDLLFAAFVSVQIAVLFGGRAHVEVTPGLTYAEYARRGFFQLLAVAALVLGVVAIVTRLAPSGRGRERRLLQLGLGILCVLTLVVLASALFRLELYEETFGFTRLRLAVHATIWWLGGIFLLVMAAGATWKAAWLPRTTLAFTVASLLLFTLVNPDGLIARRNVERFEATGNIDRFYLAGLSADAVPELDRLAEPERTCLLSLFAMRHQDRAGEPWHSYNWGRQRAGEILQSVDVDASSTPPCGRLG